MFKNDIIAFWYSVFVVSRTFFWLNCIDGWLLKYIIELTLMGWSWGYVTSIIEYNCFTFNPLPDEVLILLLLSFSSALPLFYLDDESECIPVRPTSMHSSSPDQNAFQFARPECIPVRSTRMHSSSPDGFGATALTGLDLWEGETGWLNWKYM